MDKFIKRYPLLEPDRRTVGRSVPVACARTLATRTGGELGPQADLPECTLRRHHAWRALFPRGSRLHADFRPDARRQSRAWLIVPDRRISRLRDRDRLGFVAAGISDRLHRRGADRAFDAALHLLEDGRRRTPPDAGQHRPFDRVCRPHALVVGRAIVFDPRSALPAGADAIAHREHHQRRRPARSPGCATRPCASGSWSRQS